MNICNEKNCVPGESKNYEMLPKYKLGEVKKLGHLMLDLETMGQRGNSVICAIGAVEFDIETGDTGREFFTVVDIQSCLDVGLIVNGSTINWWLMQSEKARRAIATGEAMIITQALYEFSIFIETIGGKYLQIWANGSRFDMGILEDAYYACKLNIPWDFKLERDVRTLVSFAPKIKEHYPILGTQHTPIDGCKFQIGYCSRIWQKIELGLKN